MGLATAVRTSFTHGRFSEKSDSAVFDGQGLVRPGGQPDQAPGEQAFTKTVYDHLGRPTATYLGYDDEETSWSDAASVANDTIIEQTETQYDALGRVLVTTTRQRMHNATGFGPLTSPDGVQPKARVTFVAAWYDVLGRRTLTADYGTNDGLAITRPDTPLNLSEGVLLTGMHYNAAGLADVLMDSAGRTQSRTFDAAGRVIEAVENAGGNPSAVVQATYTPDGQIATLTAVNSATGNQVTRYVYGTTLADSGIARSGLLRAEIYPDSDDAFPQPLDPSPSPLDYDRIEYRYDRQGRVVEKKDQNGTVHVYAYDGLGRLTRDSVPTLGENIDGAVRAIGRTYTPRGELATLSSFATADGQTNIVNQVALGYNGWPWPVLLSDYQSHEGAVDTQSTPLVAYEYSQGANGAFRPSALHYPNHRRVDYIYSTPHDHHLNRVTSLGDYRDDMPEILATYTYLGASAIMRVDYPEPHLRCDLAHGSGSDPYAGVNRFGRVIDLRWSTTWNDQDVERIRHGYDAAGNRLWREAPVAAALNKPFDELYSYDGLNQLQAFDRGTLNAGHTALTAKTLAQDWQLDATGNWTQFREDTDGNGVWDSTQSRTHNAANEVLTLAGSSAQIAHDRAGNMTLLPSTQSPAPSPQSLSCVYDAWNRLVKVSDAATIAVIATYAYDARNFRITATASEGVRHFYYTSNWQCIEERLSASPIPNPQSPIPVSQTVWGLRYIDDLVLRDRDAANWDSSSTNYGMEERLYFLQDPNWNVTAVAYSTGVVAERVSYTAYGEPSFFSVYWSAHAGSQYVNTDLYTGRRRDPETGLYHYRYRQYAPNLGRFLSRDPIRILRRRGSYAYIGNVPTLRVDPFGLQPYGPTPVTAQVGNPCVWAAALIPIVGGLTREEGLLWDHFVGGSGTPVSLSEEETTSILWGSREFENAVANAKADCRSAPAGTMGADLIRIDTGHPWAKGIGHADVFFQYTCDSCKVKWSALLMDRYEFPPAAPGERTASAEWQTRAVNAVHTGLNCAWREFNIGGVAEGEETLELAG